MNVEVRIEELRLHGFASASAAEIGEGLRVELERLLATGGVPAPLRAGRSFAYLNGGSLDLALGGTATEAGTRVAGAVFRTLGPKGGARG